MKLASTDGIGFREKQGFRFFRLGKRVGQFLRYRPGQDKTVLLVVGCQRSGTSMIHHLFRLDPSTVTYDEVSILSAGDRAQHLRWTDPDLAVSRIARDRSPFVVAKPLVESQKLLFWLDLLPNGKALWMFRHYADVASSNVKYFGERNGFDDLEPILRADGGDWRAENLDPAEVEIIRGLHRPDMPPHDAAALFWYARNSLFFSQGLDGDDRVRACSYDDLVTDPGTVMKAAYRFVGRPYPGDRILGDVFSGSVGLGRDLPLTPAVRDLCEGMLTRFAAVPRLALPTT
ncbi:MAG: sulfotransferase domain-containing protein [bacterium]